MGTKWGTFRRKAKGLPLRGNLKPLREQGFLVFRRVCTSQLFGVSSGFETRTTLCEFKATLGRKANPARGRPGQNFRREFIQGISLLLLSKTHLFLVLVSCPDTFLALRVGLPSLTLSINGFSFENSFFSKKFFTFQIDQEPGEFLLFLWHLVCYTVVIGCHCRYSRGCTVGNLSLLKMRLYISRMQEERSNKRSSRTGGPQGFQNLLFGFFFVVV